MRAQHKTSMINDTSRYKPTLNWAQAELDERRLAAIYDDWARDYDRDMSDAFDYASPQRMTEIVTRYLDADARILDVGVGTGLVGISGPIARSLRKFCSAARPFRYRARRCR